MGGKSSKLKIKKGKPEEGANGETEGQKEDQAQEQPIKEGDASVESKPEENGIVKNEDGGGENKSSMAPDMSKNKKSSKLAKTVNTARLLLPHTKNKSDTTEGGDKKEDKEVAQTIPVTETVALTSETASATESAAPSSQAPPSETVASTDASKEVGPAEKIIEKQKESEHSEQSAPKDPAVSSEVSEVVGEEKKTEVSAVHPIEEKSEIPAEPVVLEECEAPVEPAPAEDFVQPESLVLPEPTVAEESVEQEALPPLDLPPPPPTPAEPEEVEPASTQDQVLISDEGESTAAAPSDTAESGAATSEVTGTTEAETAAPSEDPASATVTTEFKWEGAGEIVLVSGTFNNWQENIPLTKNGDLFTKTLDLAVGEYMYKFLVDEQWMVNKSLPIKCDENGEENNVVVVELIS